MKSVAFAAALVAFVPAMGQDPPQGTPHRAVAPSAAVANSPVTRSESVAVLKKLRSIVSNVLEIPEIGKISLGEAGSAPVSRDDVALFLDKLAKICEAKFTISTARPPNLPSMANSKSAAAKAAMDRLVKGGFASRQGPLVAGPGATLRVLEYGDALGFFLLRLAELTHIPSSKFSPALMQGPASP